MSLGSDVFPLGQIYSHFQRKAETAEKFIKENFYLRDDGSVYYKFVEDTPYDEKWLKTLLEEDEDEN